MLNHDTRLYPHHMDRDRLYDFSAPVAEVSRHPSNPQLWGLKNLVSVPWKVTLASGQVVEVSLGSSVRLELVVRHPSIDGAGRNMVS